MTQSEWMVLCLSALAAVLHGISGFGFPMLSTAVLSSQYPLSLAISLVLLPCLLLHLFMLNADSQRSIRHNISHYGRLYFPLIVSSLIGSLIGVKLLLWLNEGYLKLLLGLVLLFYVIDQCRHTPLKIQASAQLMWIFGFLAGVIGGATNAMAPFLMMYLLSCSLSKTDIVIISNLSFIASKLTQLVLLFPILISINTEQQFLVLWLCVFALIGIGLGSRIRHALSQQHFKSLVLILLSIFALYALWQSAALLQQSSTLFQ